MNTPDPFDNAAMSFQEIGAALGITEAEAKREFWSAMVKLRRYVQTRPKLKAVFKELLRHEAEQRIPEVENYLKGLDRGFDELRGTEEV